MILNEKAIQKIVNAFDVGKFRKLVAKLDSGFQSDNYHIQTSGGNFVLRVIYDSVDNVEYCMEVFDYLATNGIKTPKPIRTKKGKLSHLYDNNVIVIQTFLPGTFYEEESFEKLDLLLPFFGRELGKIHRVSLQMVIDKGEGRFSNRGNVISSVKKLAKKYLPDKEYIINQYEVWDQEIHFIHTEKLTKAVIHGDVGPKDFFFKDGKYQGILDFNAAHFDFLLFDIAPMMMYCALYEPERKRQYLSFITAYLEEAPIQKKELLWLHLILRTRWLFQILFHQYRYVEGITQGLETDDVEENLEGVRDGEYFLKVTNNYPNDYFYKVIREEMN
ncbi:MAG: phosphotransferase [Candidatus Hodarchaeota archaeon]